MKVRTNLKLLRDTSGLSLRQLQEATGIPFSELSKMEHGKAVPTDLELLRLCPALQCTVDMLYPDPDTRKALAE
jgi:transcriptional regulator with XRE-family HTH domain